MSRLKHKDISFEDESSSVNVVSYFWICSSRAGRNSLKILIDTNLHLLCVKDFLWYPEANNSMKERLISWTQVSIVFMFCHEQAGEHYDRLSFLDV